MWIENHGVRSLSWPAHSPDLNPIENLWCETGQLIAKDKPTNKKSESRSLYIAGSEWDPRFCSLNWLLACQDIFSLWLTRVGQPNSKVQPLTPTGLFRATDLILKSCVQKKNKEDMLQFFSKKRCNLYYKISILTLKWVYWLKIVLEKLVSWLFKYYCSQHV